ncbi:MAG: Gfo/Idh/MocA family oxidoreductase [Verrucomicrobia bacterium]|nr:Gfo/Idh/MocA family oxidoreductase [Verrucomicrobiota bacterium]
MPRTQTCLNWGLIGASNIAKTRMIPAIRSLPDSTITAVLSSNAERAKSYAAENSIPKAYHKLDDFLQDPEIDLVYISTTNELHAAQAIAAARAGKHILSDKPLALTLADAEAMVRTAKEKGLVFGTNHHLRNAVTHRTIRRLIKEGVIGKPLAARVFHAVYLPPHLQGWRVNRPEAGGGVILDITVHDADTLHFLLDDDVQDVVARSAQQGLGQGDLADAVMGVMYFRNGTLAMFHDAFTIKHTQTGVEVHGTEGSLIAKNVMTQDPVGEVFLSRDGAISEVALGEPEDLYVHIVRHFHEAVQGRGQPFATGEDGVRSLAVGLAVQESAKTGQRVPVRYQTEEQIADGK